MVYNARNRKEPRILQGSFRSMLINYCFWNTRTDCAKVELGSSTYW